VRKVRAIWRSSISPVNRQAYFSNIFGDENRLEEAQLDLIGRREFTPARLKTQGRQIDCPRSSLNTIE